MTPRKAIRRKTGRRRTVKQRPMELRLRALIGILMFLCMLKLIDIKTFRKIAKDIGPRARPARHRRRRAKT